MKKEVMDVMEKLEFRKDVRRCVDIAETEVVHLVRQRNDAIRYRRASIANMWAMKNHFDPTDEKIPASFFVGYMDYVYKETRGLFEETQRIQNRLREWGYDVKMDMQSETLVYTDSTGLTHR